MKRLLLLGNLLAALALAAVVTFEILADRQQVISDAGTDAANLRDALTEHTRQTFSAVDIALRGVAENIDSRTPGSDDAHDMLRLRQEAFSPAFSLFLVDQNGLVTATSRTPEPGSVDLSSHPFFTAHRDKPNQGLYVAPPRLGEVGHATGRWIMNVSIRLEHADGRFAGVASAAISPAYISNFYEVLRVGEHGVVGLLTHEGKVVSRNPFDESLIGLRQSDITLPIDTLAAGETGIFRGPLAESEAGEWSIAYAQVPDLPLVVYTGISLDERLSKWLRRALIDIAVGLLAILLLSGLTWIFIRRIGERERNAAERIANLNALTQASAGLLNSQSIQDALQRVADLARELAPSHQAIASVVLDDGRKLLRSSLSDKYAAWRDYSALPDGSGIYRLVHATNEPMRLSQEQLEAHPEFRRFGSEGDKHPPLRGWLAVPLAAQDGRNLGSLQLSDRNGGEFTDEDQILIQQLANIATAAIQKLRLTEELHEAATQAHRLRADAERARRESESILRSIRDGVYAVDRAWRFVFMNRQAERYLERKAIDLIGQSIWDAFPEAQNTLLYSEYRRAVREGVDVEFNLYYEALGRWFEVRGFPHEHGLTVYFQDISTWVTQEEQLRQAQKMEAVGQLTGGIAHDFNNLLTVILGNAETVTEMLPRDSESRHLVSLINRAAGQAADLTQRLLAFSRRQALDPKATDVNQLIRELEPLLRRALGERYRIEPLLDSDAPTAMVDPNQLQNALMNLALNARDAMPDGGSLSIETTEVTIEQEDADTHLLPAPGTYVRIAVGDSGSGMAPEIRARVLEPFFTTKATGEGTGLGLPMVYGFVRQSNGHITIYSEPGEGTLIKLYIPSVKSQAKPQAQSPTRQEIPAGREKILVVEDDAMVREFTALTLKRLGYAVTAVADGLAAEAALKEGARFDLLLSDVILAGSMNGRQVAEAAQAIQPDLPVLFMSGYTEQVITHHGRLDPGARLLQKPFRRADLALKVREAIEDARKQS
ncbi:ATP-binding protein [Aquibaculum sediminis]|uniref:ATP-binding protein n=1 Tax=Aquibaculum sediminis TaxID=3231907 RepID=UPI0034555CD4